MSVSMDKKKLLKDILDACKRTKFHEAYTLCKNSYGKLDTTCAMDIIISCCNACVANISDSKNVSENDLFVLLEEVTSHLKDVNEEDLLSYLKSIFFIIKLLVKKECYGIIIKMEKILIPEFLPVSLPQKHKDTYQSSANILYNFVVKADGECYMKHKEHLLKISYIVSTIHSKIGNLNILLNMSYNCVANLDKLGVCTEEQVWFFFHTLILLKTEKLNVNYEEHFKSFVIYFTLIFHNILKKFDFEMATIFYKKSFTTGMHIFRENKYANEFALLGFPLILSPSENGFSLDDLIECKKNVKNLDESSKELIGSRLNALLYIVVVLYCKAIDTKRWCDFAEEVQLEILQFIYTLSQFEEQSEYTCPCGCHIKKNINQGISYMQYICTLLELSTNRCITLTYDYHAKAAKLCVKFCHRINVLKESGCEKWKTGWNTLGMMMYNTGVRLYQKGDEACLTYFYVLIKHFIKFEAKSGFVILKSSIVSSAFNAICSMNSKDHKKCMALSALAVVLCPSQCDNLMMHWIKAKVSQRDLQTLDSEEVQRITVISAFKKFKMEISGLIDDFDLLTVSDKVHLLSLELEQYKKRWKSKVPMMSALKELYNIADINTTVKVVVKIFGECDISVHEDVPKILQKILQQYEMEVLNKQNNNSESYLFTAILYFMQYKYCMKDTITKNADDIERTMRLAPISRDARDAISRDIHEECDIASSYECLRLDKYFSVMKYLNKSISLFSLVITEGLDFTSLGTVTYLTIYDLLLKISFEYRLHHHRVRSLQALQIALKVAQVENDPCHIVQSIGYIIEFADVTKSYVKHLILIADKQANSIEHSNFTNVKVILTYHICKVKVYLYHDYKTAYRIFQIAMELYESQEDKFKLELIKCQLLVLHYKFIMMPCAFEIVDHKKNTLLTIHSGNTTVFEMYNKFKMGGSYEMSVLLETNTELTKLYHNLRAPREVRAYCKETITLAQKLVLPLQCASYLVYLANADLRTTRYDGCQVKLNDLADILCLMKHSLQVDQENKAPIVTDLTKEVDGIVNDMQEMVLDLPMPNTYKRQLSPSSPSLVVEPFHTPAFFSHKGSCDCFYCTCFEYQELILEKIKLDALLSVKQNNFSIASDFFQGGLDLYKSCLRRYDSYVETVSSFISCDLVPEFEKELLVTYGNILLNYSYHLMRTRNKSEALRVTNKLIELVLPRKVELVYLYNEALVQKLGYIADAPCINVNTSTQLEVDNLCVQMSNVATTPESKHNQVMVSLQYSPPMPSPPKRLPRKCLKFNTSPGNDDNSKKIKIASPPLKRLPKTPASKIQTCSSDEYAIHAKTPAPKIQIFTDTKKSNKKKNQMNENDLFLVPSSPQPVDAPSSACSARTESALKAKTKLLTEKLRHSSKKPDVNMLSANNGNPGQGDVQKGRKVRKNLMSELGTLDSEPNVAQSGAVRRSTRQRNI